MGVGEQGGMLLVVECIKYLYSSVFLRLCGKKILAPESWVYAIYCSLITILVISNHVPFSYLITDQWMTVY